jgi:hypothetical protein
MRRSSGFSFVFGARSAGNARIVRDALHLGHVASSPVLMTHTGSETAQRVQRISIGTRPESLCCRVCASRRHDAEKGFGRLNACPTRAWKLLIVPGGAGGFACLLQSLKPFSASASGSQSRACRRCGREACGSGRQKAQSDNRSRASTARENSRRNTAPLSARTKGGHPPA